MNLIQGLKVTLLHTHNIGPPPLIHLEYLHQFCLTHPETLYSFSTVCCNYILDFYLNQADSESVKFFLIPL